MPDEPRPDRGRTPEPGEVSPWRLAGLGMQFAVALVAFGYAGAWVDDRLDSGPIGLLLGVFLGGGGTFYASYRRLTAPPRTDRQRSGSSGPPR